MNIWHDMNPSRVSPAEYCCVIEIPKGSSNKYELDKETGLLKLDRTLYTATHYPANYGFIPLTYGDDFDPLDVVLISTEPVVPLTIVRAYPIGVIKMMDNGRSDEKIISIPFSDPNYNHYRDISELPAHVFEEMKHFFSVYKALEKKETAVDEVMGAAEAVRIVGKAIKFYQETFPKKPKDGEIRHI